jgi:hypothetical protein
MKKSKWLPVLGIVVGLTMALCAVPVLAASVTVSVNAPAQVPCADSFTASVDITQVTEFAAGQFVVEFDSTVLSVTDVTDGMLQPGDIVIHVDGYTTPWGGDPNKMQVLVSWPPLYPGVSGAGNLCEIEFSVIGTEGQTSPINLTDGLLANQDQQDGLPIEADWLGTTVTVGPCGPFAPVLVSLVGPPPPATIEASDSAPPEPPPGFEPRDEFVPCEWVWVWGYGFEYCQWYEIYIQPYAEGVSVAPGQPLDHALSAPLGYPEGPRGVLVHVAEDGTIGPVPLFHASEEHICMYWEIVADKVPAPPGEDGEDTATNPGIYDPNEDALDAVALDEYGFHVFPEALTIMLFGVGLASLSGYVLVRKRKSADIDA